MTETNAAPDSPANTDAPRVLNPIERMDSAHPGRPTKDFRFGETPSSGHGDLPPSPDFGKEPDWHPSDPRPDRLEPQVAPSPAPDPIREGGTGEPAWHPSNKPFSADIPEDPEATASGEELTPGDATIPADAQGQSLVEVAGAVVAGEVEVTPGNSVDPFA